MAAALITGASTGIGREFAYLCAQAGYDVVLVARSEPKLQSLAADIQQKTGRTAYIFARDLSDPAAPKALYDDIICSKITVEVLINNAGFGLLGKFWELDAVEQMQIIQLNIHALTYLSRLFLPLMITNKRGKILNVASTAAFQPIPLFSVYAATKSYVLSFSEALHNEARDHNVAVTCLCPGPTLTDFDKRAGAAAMAKLFEGAMDARTVAQIGWQALNAGKPLVVAGRKNAIMAFFTRFAPIQMTATMARKFLDAS
jgi:short-subunit dehydrogenase